MSYETVRYEREGGVATVTLNRPEQRNGITNEMMRELWSVLRGAADDPAVVCLVLTGAGSAFCVGADLSAYSGGARQEPLRDEYFEIPVLLHEMRPVTVAAVNGACAGAGLGWACACDLRYASRTAMLNTAFLAVAVAGDMGLPWTLPRLVGAAKARELSLVGSKFGAAEAERLGLVNAVLEPDQLMPHVQGIARQIAASAPLAVGALKHHYVQAERMGFADFVGVETTRHRAISTSEDTAEAFRAFLEKRPPVFRGR